MAILLFQPFTVGATQLKEARLIASNSLSAITAPNFLKNVAGVEQLTDGDPILIRYGSPNTNSFAQGLYVKATKSISLWTSDILYYDVLLTASALAAAGKVIVLPVKGNSQYAIRDIKVNTSIGLSGGGGNRLVTLTDGSNVWTGTGITAALLGTPINTLWGGTGLPLPSGSNNFATLSSVNANVYFQYSGGTTDYTAGSVLITVVAQRIA